MRGWWVCEETEKLLVLPAHHEKLLIVLIFHLSSILDEELLNLLILSILLFLQGYHEKLLIL